LRGTISYFYVGQQGIMAATMESMEYLNGICTLASNAMHSEEIGVMNV